MLRTVETDKTTKEDNPKSELFTSVNRSLSGALYLSTLDI
ncbi:hypothetical protein JCM19239_6395 [Vibrio variabilis]|uniref:Uncharacterized protein n=1 Tax=Vibrio variabilis TaxID=990271 RepID=A0ABQ0JMC4_9VIBR|nr:hypothetical protein JCM19239_6395 [Vibrio variabilis]